MSQIPPARILRANLKSLTRFVVISALAIGFGALPWVANLSAHVIGVLVTLGIVSVVYAISRKRILLSAIVLLGLSLVGATVLVGLSGGLNSPFSIVLLAPIMIGTIFLGRIGGLISVVLAALSIAGIFGLDAAGILMPNMIQYNISNQLVLLGMSFFVVFGSNLLLGNTLELTAELEESYDQALAGWARALEFRDQATKAHSERVVKMTLEIARTFGFNRVEMENIRRGALLHDIGKIGVPDAILNKPEPLTEAERAEMQKHPLIAKQMLSGARFLEDCMTIPVHHHERWDGSGYPFGLKAQEIPLEARIFAVVDVWDALTSHRPYRDRLSEAEAFEYIETNKGILFDPAVTERFLEQFAEHTPEGTANQSANV